PGGDRLLPHRQVARPLGLALQVQDPDPVLELADLHHPPVDLQPDLLGGWGGRRCRRLTARLCTHRFLLPVWRHAAMDSIWCSTKASSPATPPSRPRPLSLNPPNGTSTVFGAPLLMPITPISSRSASRIAWSRS